MSKLTYEDAGAMAVVARGGSATTEATEEKKHLMECGICMSGFKGKEDIHLLPQATACTSRALTPGSCTQFMCRVRLSRLRLRYVSVE